MSTVDHRLTTIDNPFDPFDQWEQWLAFDTQMEYYTPELLARVAFNSDEMSDDDQLLATEQAIDDILKVDLLLLYRKVSRVV